MIRQVERRYYPSMWLSFMEKYNIARTSAVFDDFDNCVGLRICKSIDIFKHLRVLSRDTDPVSHVVLFGTHKIRITQWDDFLAIEEEL